MAVRGPSFWHKPVEIILFGVFSIIFGLLEIVAGVVVGPEAASSLWPLVSLAGLGMALSGIGFIMGKAWGYTGSFLIFFLAYLTGIAQAFQRVFVWGVFFTPAVLIFLLIPRVRTYFAEIKPQIAKDSPAQLDILAQTNAIPSFQEPSTESIQKKGVARVLKASNILTLIVMMGVIAPLPIVAASVHTVSVSAVTLDIIYPPGSSPDNITSTWFGFSPMTISGPMFAWGAGKMGLRFSLTNLGFFEQHTIDSIRVTTEGFSLAYSTLPVTVPDLATITFHMILQAPDHDFSGPVVLELRTT